jgi:hypothetical protein
LGTDEECDIPPRGPKKGADSYTAVTAANSDALADAVTMQPVTVVMKAGNVWRHYSSGVIRDCGYDISNDNDSDLDDYFSAIVDHHALVVGYGTTDLGTDYWLV